MPRPLNKNACNTCRQRKVKCDGESPVCQQCSKASRYCDRSERPPQIRQWSAASRVAARSSTNYQQFEPPKSPRESLQDQHVARLFNHYIANVAEWYDLSDAEQNFGIAVPNLALDEPLLFCAIISVAAMQISKTTSKNIRETAEYYHGCCVRLLIGIQLEDEVISNGVALAATCLLRSYEILDGDIDPNRHLRGAYSMASQQGLLTGNLQPSLLAAGFWNYLREDITFSLFHGCPLKMDLELIPLLARHDTDQDYLNSASLILGRVINAAFDHHLTTSEWVDLFFTVRESASSRPRRLDSYSRGEGLSGTVNSLPSVWFLRPCHASTMHYYLVCLTILTAHVPEERIEAVRRLDPFENSEECAKYDLLERWALYICGIVFTSKTPTVIVNAFGPMAYCARFIRPEPSRQELKRQLIACKPTIGWPIQRLIDSLEVSWSERERSQRWLA